VANLVKVEFKQTNHIHVCESHNVIDIITDQIDLFELSHEEIQARGNFWSENRYPYARFGVLLFVNGRILRHGHTREPISKSRYSI